MHILSLDIKNRHDKNNLEQIRWSDLVVVCDKEIGVDHFVEQRLNQIFSMGCQQHSY